MLKRILPFAVVLILLAAAAAWLWARGSAEPTDRPADTAAATGSGIATEPGLPLEIVTIEDRRHSPQPQAGEEIAAKLQYVKTGRTVLDELIELWIGTQCPTANLEGKPGTPQACVQQLLDECLKPAEGADASQLIRCKYQAEMKPVLNGNGLLTLSFTGDQHNGGAHGSPTVAYLNIDAESGDPLRLQNLVRIKPDKLQALLDRLLRAQRGIAPEQPLTAAGLLVETLPVPEAVLVENDGLRFTWQAYEIAPYADGQPSLLVPYTELKKSIPAGSPLQRLPAAR